MPRRSTSPSKMLQMQQRFAEIWRRFIGKTPFFEPA
jgi:hypothetical protein